MIKKTEHITSLNYTESVVLGYLSCVICIHSPVFPALGLCVCQVKVREEDEGWIYGMYTCRSTNKMGSADWPIDLKRASTCLQTFP